jgi:hypothetical protein
MLLGKQSFIAIVNGVVGSVCSCDQKIGIEKDFLAMNHVIWSQWIHVMHKKSVVDLVTLYSEIATVVTNNRDVPSLFPLTGCVELLVDPSIKAKS